MAVVVTTKSQLEDALKNKESSIIVRGKLAKKIFPLSIFKHKHVPMNLSTNMGFAEASGALSSLVGIPVVVAITLIVTIGLVAIIAILRDYRIVHRKGDSETILERN